MPAKQRVAIIGTGNIARAHARAYAANADVAQLVAVADVDQERATAFAAQHGAEQTFGDAGEMLRQARPDAVSICTPNYLHAPLTIQALEAGVHVLCEKPMATTLAAAEQMKAAAARTGKVLYIGFNHRFIGKFAKAKELLDGGQYGKLLVCRIAIGHGMWERLSQMWFAKKELSGGGTLIDNGVHMLDMLRWYGGSLTTAQAQVKRLKMQQGDVEDNAIAVFQLGNGGMASLQCSWTWPPSYTLLFHMICEQGAIDLSGDDVIAYRDGETAPETIAIPATDNNAQQAAHFLAAARGEEPPFVTPDDGIAAVRAALAAYQSSEQGRTVEI